MRRKLVLVIVVILMAALLAGCGSSTVSGQQLEAQQQASGVEAIVRNQPVPDLGGYSLERANLIRIMLLRNQKIATWTYHITFDGTVIEVCPSQGYPFPYSAQLTSPEVWPGYMGNGYREFTMPQPELNSLYSPDSANASWVLCVVDGTAVPVYYEENVQAFPYRIKADIVLEPITAPSILFDDIDIEEQSDVPQPTADALPEEPALPTPLPGLFDK